jgi:hypothetical protein
MRVVPEAVKRQKLRFFDVRPSFRSAHVGKDVEREATVTVPLPPHLEAEPDVAGFEDVCATVVFDRVPLGNKGLSRAGCSADLNRLARSPARKTPDPNHWKPGSLPFHPMNEPSLSTPVHAFQMA